MGLLLKTRVIGRYTLASALNYRVARMKSLSEMAESLRATVKEYKEYSKKQKDLEPRLLHEPIEVPGDYNEPQYKKFTNLQKARIALSSLIRLSADVELIGHFNDSEKRLKELNIFREGLLSALGTSRGDLPKGVILSQQEIRSIGKLLKELGDY